MPALHLPTFLLLLAGMLVMLPHAGAQIPNTLRHSLPGPASTIVQAGAQLGYSVATDGNLIVMGAPFDNTGGSPPTNVSIGVAKVFDATTGELLHVLVNPEPWGNGKFGTAVAVSGARVCITAPGNFNLFPTPGKAYVYDLASDTPTLPVLVLPNTSALSSFGRAVAISGTRICVGVPGGAGDLGAVMVYDLESTTVSHVVGFLSSSTATTGGNLFGYAVAMSGTRVAVGDPLDTSGGQQGTVSVF
jgi:hypothetical protein